MVTFTLILVPLTDHSNCGHVIVAEEQVLGKHLLLPCPKKVDVLALQEDALTPTERESFVRYVTKDIYSNF